MKSKACTARHHARCNDKDCTCLCHGLPRAYYKNWKPEPLTGGLGEPLDGRVHIIHGCDAPLCEYEGKVTDCDGCGGEFCQKHSEQEHHSCKALSPYA